ncbi:MAG: RHS repeat domain-containing protein [Candidatus Methylomirabilales bacterium]
MAQEGDVAASFDAIRPVIRWEVQHDGRIHLETSFSLRNVSKTDGVQISILQVTDPHSPAGTQVLTSFVLDRDHPKQLWREQLDVKFRWSIMVVFDPLEETPVTEKGVLLDEVDTKIHIRYQTVCTPGVGCHELTGGELDHRGPTGTLAYVYDFPKHFRISELPREPYWHLLPPLGPPVSTSSGASAKNQVVVNLRKVKTTDTPVHVRVRCESLGSQHGTDDHVCPLGTVLQNVDLPAEAIIDTTLTVPLPEPFLSKPVAPPTGADCMPFVRTSLRVDPLADGTWRLTDGISRIMTMTTKADAERLLDVARHHASRCYVGPRPAPQFEVHHFFFGRVPNPSTDISWETIQDTSDCIAYSPFALSVEQLPNNQWLLRSGPIRLMVVSTQQDAEIAKRFASHYTRACFVGRGNALTGTEFLSRHRDYVDEYFDAPIDRLLDPTRILVEVDGEAGFEVPPSAVSLTSHLDVVSLRRIQQTSLLGQPPLIYGSNTVREFVPPENMRSSLRPLYRVHPARQLHGFRVERQARRLVVLATLVKPRHPLHISLTGDHFEGAAWQTILSPSDASPGAPAVSRRYELTIRAPGVYYLRGYTEASFDRDASVQLSAFFETCQDPDFTINCTQEPVPVNLLRADFGYGFAVPDPQAGGTRIDTLGFGSLVGEVAHSFEPFAGGHHGFFYGLFRGGEALTCIDPYGCATKYKPHPLEKHFISRADPASYDRTRFVAGCGSSTTERLDHALTNNVLSPDSRGNGQSVVRVALVDRPRAAAATSIIEPGTEYRPGECVTTIEVRLTTGTIRQKVKTSDADGDGICDIDDTCPLVAEDYATPVRDGCPEGCARDSDGDGLPDCVDVCPFQRGDDVSGFVADGCARRHTAPDDPPLIAPDPVPSRDEGDPAPTDQAGCYVGGDYSSWICGDGTTHASHRNETGGGGTDHFARFSSIDGFRRTWVFGLSLNVGFSATVAGVNASLSIGAQYSDRDVFDWNGDGLVDRVSPNIITLAGRNREVRLGEDCYARIPLTGDCAIHPGVHESISSSIGYGITVGGGSGAIVLKTDPEGEVKDQAQLPNGKDAGVISLSFSSGANAHFNHSATISQRIDVNGDGLPDQVFGDANTRHLKVRLNLGSKLGAEFEFPLDAAMPDSGDTAVRDLSQMISNLIGRRAIAAADSFTRSETNGGGGGIDVGIVGGSGSYYEHGGLTITQNTLDFADVNGDGLIDLLMKESNSATMGVAFNLGDHFSAPKSFSVRSWVSPVSTVALGSGLSSAERARLPASADPLSLSGSDVEGWSGSGSVTVFFVTVSGSYAHNTGRSTTALALRDIDGDGIPDRLLRTGGEPGGALQVSRGLFGRANLLWKIERPFGGVMELDFAKSVPSEEAPRARWNLSKVSVRQLEGFPEGAQSPPMETTIDYEDPSDHANFNAYYDRYERESFGYRTVRVVRLADGRVIDREFNNRDYWLKGNLVAERVKDATGRLLMETLWTYSTEPWPGLTAAFRDQCLAQLILPERHLDTPELRGAQRTPCDVRAPRLVEMQRRSYDGGDSYVPFVQRLDQYDTHSNVTKVVEEHGGASHPTLVATIAYEHRPALLNKHIVDRVREIAVRRDTDTGQLLRHRTAQYDDRGNLTRHVVTAEVDATGNPTKSAIFDVTPDVTGFVTFVKDANGYEITYVPDLLTYTVPVTTSDSFGLTTTTAYDFRFQQITDTTDANGNVIERRYDRFGRLEKVRGPYERAANVDTIDVQYGSLAPTLPVPVRSLTTNRSVDPDTLQEVSTLRVARFVEGLGREIQVQTEAEVNGQPGRTISGRVEFDAAGRTVTAGHPVFLPDTAFDFQAITLTENCAIIGPVYCTKTTYDALDRPLVTKAPGDITTTRQYGLVTHPRDSGRLVRETQLTDPENKVRRLLHDAADRLVGVVELLDSRELKTTYDYSAAGDLLAISDARDNNRSFEYDVAGRRIAIVTPDTGRVEMAYDAMGNLVQQTDQELCSAAPPLLSAAACSTKIVRRTYDKNRLTAIDYSSSPDVTFAYGDTDAAKCAGLANTKGRVCWVQDGAGTETRSFGALGEPVRQERTLPLFGGSTATATYSIDFRYETFGRMLWVQYPDSEKVTNAYNVGGRVKKVTGVRGGSTTEYVLNREYDVFGKPLATNYGNGTAEENVYEADTQRLKARVVRRGEFLISSLDLGYDKASNVKTSITQRNEGHTVAGLERSYTYDDLHRLQTFIVTGKEPAGTEVLSINGNYDYDDVGNITLQKMAGTGSSAAVSRNWIYTYGVPTRPNLPDTVGPQRFDYNGRGATAKIRSSAEETMFTWDEEGDLSSSTLTTSTAAEPQVQSIYRYDANGARMWRQTNTSDALGPANELLHYPNPYYTAATKRVRPDACGNDTCAALTLLRTKHIRIDGGTVASVVGFVDPGFNGSESLLPYLTSSTSYVHTDQVRSTVTVTGISGMAERVFEYLPFGETISEASMAASQGPISFLSFSGMEGEDKTEQFYIGARYYKASLARWLSADLTPVSPNSVQEENRRGESLYIFNHNNPLAYRDPDGKMPVQTNGPFAPSFVGFVEERSRSSAEKAGRYLHSGNIPAAVFYLFGGLMDSIIAEAGRDPVGLAIALIPGPDAPMPGRPLALKPGPPQVRGRGPGGPAGPFIVTPEGTAVPVHPLPPGFTPITDIKLGEIYTPVVREGAPSAYIGGKVIAGSEKPVSKIFSLEKPEK